MKQRTWGRMPVKWLWISVEHIEAYDGGNDDAIEIRSVAGGIVEAECIGAGVQLHAKHGGGGLVKRAPVEIELQLCSVVDGEKERARPAGRVVHLKLVDPAGRNRDVGESDGIARAATDVACLRETRAVIAEGWSDRAAESGSLCFVHRCGGRGGIAVSTDDDAVEIRWITGGVAELRSEE